MKPRLRLNNLNMRHPALSHFTAKSYCDAAAVCLQRHHTPPIHVSLVHSSELEAKVAWIETDFSTQSACDIDTTDAGAYCIALAAIEITDGLVAHHRAETPSGADFYLYPGKDPLGPPDSLENSHRFEVRGINDSEMSDIRAMLQQMVAPARSGNGNLPAIAAVVGFSLKRIEMEDVT